jgi:K+-sensing histidine kinase KdpD
MNYTRPQLATMLEPIRKAFLDAKSRNVELRYVTEITKDNISYCKELMTIVDELRHLDGIKGSFMVSEKEYLAPIILFEKGKVATQIIYSNVKEIVEHQRYVYDTLWSKGIFAENKIIELEQGIKQDFIETVKDPVEAQMIGFDLIISATEEILIIFSTANAFYRQMKVAGTMQLLKEAASKRGVNIRILTPKDERIKQTVQVLMLPEDQQRQQQQKREAGRERIDIRYIEPALQTKTTVLVVDKKFSLSVELKDDTKDNSYEAIGLATYSNSKSTVLSYSSIFEGLWAQTELYQQLKVAHEQLKIHDKMQKEFINIAAHELRTPIQPIIGLTEVLYSKTKDTEQRQLLDAVLRNSKRLQRLTEDILDVTKIESQSLQLRKEQFNLNGVVADVVEEYSNRIKKDNNNVNLLYKPNKDIILVEADENRLTQVISNLLSNAIKFTNEGTIFVSVEKKDDQTIVSVKDTGTGINPEILPRLFTKFATKSQTGTGLGLFISKSIVEAHGGKIWAENNADGRGATFSFTLPIEAR